MRAQVKICGLTELTALHAALEAGARFVGLVFYPPSPRYVTIDTAKILARHITTGTQAIGLFVDPSNEELEKVITSVQLDMIQLHGHESPGRVAEVKAMTGLQVMKAIPVAESSDLDQVPGYEVAADWLMFDTKAPEHGGSGRSFDWSILEGKTFKKPWMLAGGLNAENVGEALRLLKPDAVDISSGVEREKGIKDPDKIRAFLEAIKNLDSLA